MEDFGSEKIMEKKGGFLQALNEPFWPPSMQFHNPKGAVKARENTQALTRFKRQELVKKAIVNSSEQSKNNKNITVDNAQNKPIYASQPHRPILKVKSAADQYREENKSADVLLSQDAMKTILTELQQLRQLKADFEKFKEDNSKLRDTDSKTDIDRSRVKDKIAKEVSFGSNKDISRKSELERSLENIKEEMKHIEDKDSFDLNKKSKQKFERK